MNIDIAHGSFYKVNNFLMYITGQWPYYSKKQRIIILIFVYLFLISLFIPEVLGLISCWGDIDQVIECVAPNVIMVASLILLTNSILSKQQIEILFKKINNDWTTWSSGPEFDILCNYSEKGRLLCLTYIGYGAATLIVWFCIPFVPIFLDFVKPLNESRPKNPLYPTEYYVDVNDYFYWILLHGCVCSALSIIIILSVDLTFMIINQHACGILSILGYRLKNINKRDDKCRSLNQNIAFCVQVHIEVILFVQNIRKYLSNSFLIMLGFNIISVSVSGAQAVFKLDYPKDSMRFAALTVAQFIHLFFLTAPCQELINHSIRIPDCVYESCWYELPVKHQKMLLIIMKRSKEPCIFSVGKIYTYSMSSFASVVHTSMSYFTVLLSTR